MNAAMTFCETHANMTEGFWSLLRSVWQSRRGALQESFPFHSVS